MILALLTAGGLGCRMNNKTPKQFVNVAGRPVIIHTLAAFQNHPDIDVICVACLAGGEQWLLSAAREYGITKLRHIVAGGKTGQESIKICLNELHQYYSDNDMVLIHDGVRPMVSSEIISGCINTAKKYGNAITAIPCQEAILTTTDGRVGQTAIPRDTLRRTQTPHAFKLGDIIGACNEADNLGITNNVACCDLMVKLARPVYFCAGSEKNIKLTTPEDFDIFRALLKVKK